MRTILLILTNPWSVRNLLLTGMTARLAAESRTVVLLPEKCLEKAREHAGAAELRPLVFEKQSFTLNKLAGLKDEIWFHESPTETIRLKRDTRDEAYVNLGPVRKAVGAAAYRLGVRMKDVDRLQVLAEGERSFAGRILDEVRPDLVVGTPLFRGADIPFVRLCRRRGIRTAAFIQSWDNVSAKSYVPAFPDRLLVWNDHVGADLVRYHEVDPKTLRAIGIPQFDIYREILEEGAAEREAFLEGEGLDPAKRVVVYTTATPRWPLAEERTTRRLAEAIDRGEIPDAQLLIRPHPLEDPRRYADVAAETGAVVQKTLGGDGVWGLEDLRRLGRTMRWADCVVNFMSTITIDAAYFDTPVVNTMFALGDVPRKEKLPRYYRSTHYLPILASGGVRVATSAPEMVRLVNEYLANPGLDAPGRRRIAREEIVHLDGSSVRRTAEAILEML